MNPFRRRVAWALSLAGKRIVPVLSIAVAAAVVTGAAYLRAPRTWSASFGARLIRSRASTLLEGIAGPSAKRSSEQEVETLLAVVGSRAVAERAVGLLPFLPKDAPAEERSRLASEIVSGVRTRRVSGAAEFDVTVAWGESAQCLEVARALVVALDRQEVARRRQGNQDARDRLAAWRDEAQMPLGDLEDLRARCALLEEQGTVVQQRTTELLRIEAGLAGPLEGLQAEEARLRERYGHGYPPLARVESEVAALERIRGADSLLELDEVLSTAEGSAPAERKAYVEKKRAALLLRAELAWREEVRGATAAAVSSQLGPTRTPRDVEVEIQARRAQVDEAQARMKTLRAAMDVVSPSFEVTRRPTLPASPDSPRAVSYVLAGAAAFLLLSFLLLAAFERIDPRIATLHDARRGSGIEVLGLAPNVPQPTPIEGKRKGTALLFTEEGRHPSADAFRIAATNSLAMLGQLPPGKCSLVVTSPEAGEGKTMCAANLACAFAEGKSQTLLIDGHLRRPAVAATFDVDQVPGVVEVLHGDAQPSTVTRQVRPGLWVIPAGYVEEDSFQLLTSPRMQDLLRSVADRYDVVIIDGGPLLTANDALVLAPRVDGMLVVCALDQTTRDALREAIGLATRARGRVLGVVATRPRSKPSWWR